MKIHAIILATVCAVVGGTYPDTGRAGMLNTTIQTYVPNTWDIHCEGDENYTPWDIYQISLTPNRAKVLSGMASSTYVSEWISSLHNMGRPVWNIYSSWGHGSRDVAIGKVVFDAVVETTRDGGGDATLYLLFELSAPMPHAIDIPCRVTERGGSGSWTGGSNGYTITLPRQKAASLNIQYSTEVTLTRDQNTAELVHVENQNGTLPYSVTWEADSNISAATLIRNNTGVLQYGTTTLQSGTADETWYIELKPQTEWGEENGNVRVTITLQ